jgi:hypothetical protein
MSGIQLYQLKDYVARSKIGTLVGEVFSNWITLLIDKFDKPMDVRLEGSILTVEASVKQKLESNGAGSTQSAFKWRLPPIAGRDIQPVESSLNFSNGVTTADIIVEDAPVMTAGWYVQMGLELREDGKYYTVWGVPAVDAGSVGFAKFNDDASAIIAVVLRDDGTGGTWHFVTPTKPEIYLMGSVGSGGGGGGDSSFKLSQVSGSTVQIKKGKKLYDRGHILFSGNIATDAPVNVIIDLASILSVPVATTLYWLVIDFLALPDAVTLSDTKQQVYQFYNYGHFKLLAVDLKDVQRDRYFLVGSVYTPNANWTGAVMKTIPPGLFTSLAGQIGVPEVATYQITSAQASVVTNHGLRGEPQVIHLYYYDSSAGKKHPVDSSNCVLNKGSTSIEINSQVFPFDAGDYLEVSAVFAPNMALSTLSSTYNFKSSWFSNSAITQVAHGLADASDIVSYEVQEWDVTAGKFKNIERSGLVLNFDNTNIYLDWSGLAPSANLRYRVVTGNTAMPAALLVARKNTYSFTDDVTLTDVTTAFPVTVENTDDEPSDIVVLQKVATDKWQKIVTPDLVFVEKSSGIWYLRGDLSTLIPSALNPVKIIVK